MSFIVHVFLKTQNFSSSLKGPTTASQQQSYLATEGVRIFIVSSLNSKTSLP